ncbi:BREX-1 system adenine-specific DNA-methyltransferase PglX, partial [Escherichia coli]|nr:BREX-1 system adenine-specific DNA-methyltransferase PglX [Escherichia coli]
KGAANQAPKTLQAIKNPECGWFYKAKSDDFKKIPGSPIAYWVSEIILQAFENGVSLKTIGDTRQGMATSDNNRFLRLWFEVNFHSV